MMPTPDDWEALEQARKLADRLDIGVRMFFNDTPLDIEPGGDTEAAILAWWSNRKAMRRG